MQQLQEYAPYLFYSASQQTAQLPQAQQQYVSTQSAPITNIAANSSSPEGLILPQVIQPEIQPANQVQPSVALSRPSRSVRKKVIVGVILVLILMGVGGLLFVLKKGSSSLTSFTDKNFSMKIPKNWSRDGSYKPGSTLVLYYSPEGSGSRKGEAAAKFTAYIAIEFDRIEAQINYLNGAKAEYKIIRNDSFDVGDTHYHLVEIVSKLLSEDEQMHTMYINATRGDFVISADVVSTENDWKLHAQESEAVLRSIVPGCSKLAHKKELFSEVSQLCTQ